MVKDEGSWLDIGTTISHFVISSLLCVFVALLEGLSEILIKGVEVDGYEERVKEVGGTEVVHGNGVANGRVKKKNIQEERPSID